MMIASLPANEADRLVALHSYHLLDTAEEQEFDEIVALASSICETSISTITLVDSNRQWRKARVGNIEKEGSRDFSFCAHSLNQTNILEIQDASFDNRFFDNPMVTGNQNIRFYAGMPLISPDGFNLGTLCVIDQQPKKLNDKQRLALQILGKQVVKQMELKKKMEELKKLNEANAKLLSLIGHDLRSPMSSLFGLLELAEKHDLSPDELTTFLGKIRQNFNSTNELLSNLLAWATAQFSDNQFKTNSFSIKHLVDDVIISIKVDTEKKGNSVINLIDDTYLVVANENMIMAVLRNLLLNANKFTDRGLISVSASIVNGQVVVCVTDTGVGMEPEKVAGMFSWATRSSTPGTKGERGSGFGLLACKDFVEQHGGRIWVTSTLGQGSSFYFSLIK